MGMVAGQRVLCRQFGGGQSEDEERQKGKKQGRSCGDKPGRRRGWVKQATVSNWASRTGAVSPAQGLANEHLALNFNADGREFQ